MTPPPAPPPGGGAAEALPPLRGTGRGLRRPTGSVVADRVYLLMTAAACAAAVIGIGFLIWQTAGQTGDVWDRIGVWNFLSGTEWIANPADGGIGRFGALPFIYGTLMTSAIAMVLAVPTAIGIALATTVFLPKRLRRPVAAVVDLLAAIPSVIYGLWGITVLVPFTKPLLQWMADNWGGLSIAGWRPFEGPVTSGSYLISGLVLGVMVLPIITAITREVLSTVPVDQQESAFALGATRWEMVRHSMLPWSRSGIVGASALGLGRAVGETIAIALLLGNSPGIFDSLLGPGSTLAGVIALETNEAGDLQLAALTALAIVLFVIAFVINALARLLVSRSAAGRGVVSRVTGGVRDRIEARRHERGGTAHEPLPHIGTSEIVPVSPSRIWRQRIAVGAIYASLLVGLVPLGALLVQMLVKGAPAISGAFFTDLPPLDPNIYGGGIKNAIVGTLILMGLASLFAVPLGILSALFISENSPSVKPIGAVARGIGFVVDILLGVPSIVVGLIVYLGLVKAMGHYSALAGGVALAIIMFPIVVRSADEILRLVPQGHREAALALGAPRWRTAWSVILPAALPGIVTGAMLALARASGETAPLLFTSFGNQFFSSDLMEPIQAIPQTIFTNTIQTVTPASEQLAWGAALVLVAMIMILNLFARLISRRARGLEKR